MSRCRDVGLIEGLQLLSPYRPERAHTYTDSAMALSDAECLLGKKERQAGPLHPKYGFGYMYLPR